MPKAIVVLLLITLGSIALQWLPAEPIAIRALCLLWIIAVLWLSEMVHVTITALLIPVLSVLFGIWHLPQALDAFSHPIIFVFFGGFALAAALQAQDIDRWIAHNILRMSGGLLSRAVMMLCLTTAVLSMWMNNTATTALMLPLILGLLRQEPTLSASTKIFSLLGIAYSANLGGVATLVGSAPNGIAATAIDYDFLSWLKVGGPAFLLLWPLMLWVMHRVLKPSFNGTRVEVEQYTFEWTPARMILMGIFTFTVIGWFFSKPLGQLIGIEQRMNAWVALLAVCALVASRVVEWKHIEEYTHWGTLLLFGGSLTLSAVLKVSGASAFLGSVMSHAVMGLPGVLVLVVLVSFVILLTEINSNTSSTALLVPIFITLPVSVVGTEQAALAVGISASCAFMLPVATPPNAIVHSSGLIPQQSMMRVGAVLNVMCIGVLSLLLWLLL
ncbi:DASS family sodium-coupled anion symporter [Marinibactrum halimedae]|uniref:NadC family protein n=1 Tax=Marinibactrum halimedae TaxID=1444977 RepID=A0AA37T4F3_9GAMM|nr:DASS family sodium-coupled anion symporter [Marinibactrum halimedae]MCD9457684.1 DASS family sodium-coupled anion symporter [Marinibactrum halimedae]GLS24943.1 NadC family protein [Marinibactrum halimedae]